MGTRKCMTVTEEQTFLTTLKETKGDLDAAIASVPQVDPSIIDKKAAFEKVGLKLPVEKDEGKKPEKLDVLK